MKRRFALLIVPMFCCFGLMLIPTMVFAMVAPVSTVKPSTITYQETLSYTGEVVKSDTREIYLETAVIPSNIVVEPGDYVQKGSVIAYIDTALTQTVLAQGATVSTDQEQAKQAESLYQQYGKTYGLSQEQIAQVFGSNSTSVTKKASTVFIPSAITAPMDGIITEVNITQDVLSSASNPAIVMNAPQSSKVIISVPQSDVDFLSDGTKATISGDGLEGKSYDAVIKKIYPTAKKRYNGMVSETVVDIELTVLNSDASLKGGYTVDVVLELGEEKTYFSLPYEAVCQNEKNEEFVWVIRQGRAYQQKIVTGQELPDAVEIISGISPDDTVVLYPESLKQRQLVSPKQEG